MNEGQKRLTQLLGHFPEKNNDSRKITWYLHMSKWIISPSCLDYDYEIPFSEHFLQDRLYRSMYWSHKYIPSR